MGAVVDPAIDFVRFEPGARFDFVRMKRERAFMLALVDPDELLAGIGTGVDFEESSRGGWQLDSEFLSDLAESAGIVIFAAIEVARGGGIPGAGEAIFEARTFLEKELAALVEDEDVNGAVFEAELVNFSAAFAADHAVELIDDVKKLFACGAHR